MTSNTNNNSDQVDAQLHDELHDELLYELLLYKKKDIIAIQEKLALDQIKKGKTLKDSFRLLFDLVGELIDIRGDLDVTFQPILTILYENIEDLEEFMKMSLGTLYHLLLYLEEEISTIQDHLGIDGYTNQEISGLEADKNARAYLQKFRRSLRKCSKCGNTEIHR
ncbi:hypothetical protein GLOIN_2v1773513 [Rhizophagus clarus]|uniref:Uncharacterized protein n=1 Tax=Rhizophagus clarus TaxID=94130 RepID=A0A8H3QG78_9GLOM|nr:hypothetical protein GLOIN_2v1773513 [Rhizophagus clarus]